MIIQNSLVSGSAEMTIEHRAILNEEWDICLCTSKNTDRKVWALLPSSLYPTDYTYMSLGFHAFLRVAGAMAIGPEELTEGVCHTLMTEYLNREDTRKRFSGNLKKWHSLSLVSMAAPLIKTPPRNSREGVGKYFK